MDINKIKRGSLLAVETRNNLGAWWLAYGPVMNIDLKTRKVVINTKERGFCEFDVEQLWPYHSLVNHKNKIIENLKRESGNNESQEKIAVLGGFLMAIAEGKIKPSGIQEIAGEIRSKTTIRPAGTQEVLEILLNGSKTPKRFN